MTARTDLRPPELFDGQPPTEILVPIIADYHYERGISIAARFAATWGLPIRLLHVRTGDDPTAEVALDVIVKGLRSAHPELLVDGGEVEADDVVGGIEATASDRSLVLLASDETSQWLETDSVGEAILSKADEMVMLCGPGCVEQPTGSSVIVPLDGSPRAEAAIEPGIEAAAATGGMLWVVTVVPPETVEAVAERRAAGERVSESGYLRRVADDLAERGVEVGWEVVHHGDPVAGVSSIARDQGAALVVAATHGESGLAKRIFGSICLGLVERGPVPVLVIKTDRADSIPLPAPDDPGD